MNAAISRMGMIMGGGRQIAAFQPVMANIVQLKGCIFSYYFYCYTQKVKTFMFIYTN